MSTVKQRLDNLTQALRNNLNYAINGLISLMITHKDYFEMVYNTKPDELSTIMGEVEEGDALIKEFFKYRIINPKKNPDFILIDELRDSLCEFVYKKWNEEFLYIFKELHNIIYITRIIEENNLVYEAELWDFSVPKVTVPENFLESLKKC